MKTKKVKFVLVVLLFSSLHAMSQDAKEIIRQMEHNMRGDASYTEMTMKTVRPRYTREISMKSWNLGDDYSLIYVTAPARDLGTAFLKRGNEIWNYVPNLGRTIKMPPSMMSQSWMGSDFSNDDLVRGISTVDDYSHRLLGTESINGHKCFKVELIPHPETPVVYEKVIYWISKEYYLPMKVENFDESGNLVNTINFGEVKNIGGRKIPAVMEMIPEDKRGRKTILTTHEADFGIDISQSFFSIQNLTSVR